MQVSFPHKHCYSFYSIENSEIIIDSHVVVRHNIGKSFAHFSHVSNIFQNYSTSSQDIGNPPITFIFPGFIYNDLNSSWTFIFPCEVEDDFG